MKKGSLRVQENPDFPKNIFCVQMDCPRLGKVFAEPKSLHLSEAANKTAFLLTTNHNVYL